MGKVQFSLKYTSKIVLIKSIQYTKWIVNAGFLK
jgi:hypothetical protein